MPSDTHPDTQGGSPSAGKKGKLPSVAKRSVAGDAERSASLDEKIAAQEVISMKECSRAPMFAAGKGIPGGKPSQRLRGL